MGTRNQNEKTRFRVEVLNTGRGLFLEVNSTVKEVGWGWGEGFGLDLAYHRFKGTSQ